MPGGCFGAGTRKGCNWVKGSIQKLNFSMTRWSKVFKSSLHVLGNKGTWFQLDSMAMQSQKQARLPPEVNRILFVKGMPYDITADEVYDLFGKYGSIRQVRLYVHTSFSCYSLLAEIGRTRRELALLCTMIFTTRKTQENISGILTDCTLPILSFSHLVVSTWKTDT